MTLPSYAKDSTQGIMYNNLIRKDTLFNKRSTSSVEYDWYDHAEEPTSNSPEMIDDPQRPITDPSNYVAMIKKTVTSALKDEVAPLIDGPGFLSEKTSTWLNRSEASLTHNPDIIATARSHYQWKMNMVADDAQVDRAREKKQSWTTMSRKGLDCEMEAYLMDAANNYGNQARRYREAQWEAQSRGNNDEARKLQAKFQHAKAMRQVWNQRDDRATALRYAREELIKFKESWDEEVADDGQDTRLSQEMRDHAMNAIAWNIKAKRLA